MGRKQIVEQIRGILKIESNKIKATVDDLIEDIKDIEDESIKEELELIKNYLTYSMNNLKNEQDIFKAIPMIGNIESQIDIVESKVSQLTNSGHIMKMKNFIDNIKAKIKNLASHFWQLLSQMMTLKQWSVTGNSNVDICGFSAGATLQFTFGS